MGWNEAVLLGRPEGKNEEEKNEGGLVIFIKNGPHGREEEVARVAWDRSEGAHPDVSFNDKADEAVEIARKTMSTIRELFENAGNLQ